MTAETDRTARLLDALYPDELENSALGAEEVERLRAAIDADPEAQAQLAAWSAVRAAAARLPEREPDPQVHYDILRAARSAPHLEKKVSFFERLWAWSLNPAVAAVGLLIVAGSLFAVYSGRQDTSADRFAPTADRPPTTGVAASAAPDDQTAERPAESPVAEGAAVGLAQGSSKQDAPDLPRPEMAQKEAEKRVRDLAEKAAKDTPAKDTPAKDTGDGDARRAFERAAGATSTVAAEPPPLVPPPAPPAEPPADMVAEEAAANLRAATAKAPSAPERAKVAIEAAAQPKPAPEPEPAPTASPEAKVAAAEAPQAEAAEAAAGDAERAEPVAAPSPARAGKVDLTQPPPPQSPPRKKVGGLAPTDAPESAPVTPAVARKSAPPSPARAPTAQRAEAGRSAAPIGMAARADEVDVLDPFPAANGPAQPSAGAGRAGRGAGGLGNGAPGGTGAGRVEGDARQDADAAAKGGAARSAGGVASGALGGARAPAEPDAFGTDAGAVPAGAASPPRPTTAAPAAPAAPAPAVVVAPTPDRAPPAETRAGVLDRIEADADEVPSPADEAPSPADGVSAEDARPTEAEGAPVAETDDALSERETRAAAQGDASRARRPATTATTAASPSLAEQAQAFETIVAAGGPAALGAAFEAAKIYERLGNLARARTLYAQVAAAPGPNAEAARARLKILDAARK